MDSTIQFSIKERVLSFLPPPFQKEVISEEYRRKLLQDNGTPVNRLQGEELKLFILNLIKKRNFFSARKTENVLSVSEQHPSHYPDADEGQTDPLALVQTKSQKKPDKVKTEPAQKFWKSESESNCNIKDADSCNIGAPTYIYYYSSPHSQHVDFQSASASDHAPNGTSYTSNFNGRPYSNNGNYADNRDRRNNNNMANNKDLYKMITISTSDKKNFDICAEHLENNYIPDKSIKEKLYIMLVACQKYHRDFPTWKIEWDPKAKPNINRFKGGYLLDTEKCPEEFFKRQATHRIFLDQKTAEYIFKHCFKCGHPDCNPNSENCIYAQLADSFAQCDRCYRGLHLTKDCLFRGRNINSLIGIR